MGRLFTANQVLGRTQTIGCVAIEITQKCNLDCTLCYLSEHSQSVRDIPLSEVFRRLDEVVEHYGSGTNVQITGGDPTLRKHIELIEIVRYACDIGLYPALFTNGIAASRGLLKKLNEAGLCEVAFHVDSTQQRPGYGNNEADLHPVREEYIERCRDLGLMVIFNTTVHQGNFEQIPALVKFFSQHADKIGLVSFQLQAETGRGVWGARANTINQESVKTQINTGVNTSLPWGVVQIGHSDCHSYMPTLVVNNTVYPVIDDPELLSDFLHDFVQVRLDRRAKLPSLISEYLLAALKQPKWWPKITRFIMTKIKLMGRDAITARGQVNKLSFFVQNFMDAKQLQQERIEACSFMVMTTDGPVSMCQHNAQRNDYILQPINIVNKQGEFEHYEPLPGHKSFDKSSKHINTQ